ncbi:MULTISPECIES: DUF3800 domain-containing protein [unclassified Mesorhizobium]|uniref:DUF3800 domain-containing protein n=1 Tax=unclassified Mesorhizobium TaxID=325217 RepID=UPI001125EBCC|nr:MULTISPECIES: DUF3800 domain-containing protein [unclassified Mesorhizobium]MBZ9768152.1 DUF3800 domain-containing protein [Mesorhizobium sp. CA6]MBZ9862124.1 DUF3800 domain-containing protein [Mesorhizobium sp. CA12]TPI78092.1 DUF3800 domain-containing protein [Mesorhizobium sp. B2-8-9]
MLQAYVDESVSINPAIYVLAGLIAPAENWTRFSADWADILSMKPRIGRFKMSEAMNCVGEFASWSQDRRDERILLLQNVISDHVEAGVVAAVMVDDFSRIIKGSQLPQQFHSPYYFLLYQMILKLADGQDALELKGPVNFIFDDQMMEKKKVRRDWARYRSLLQGRQKPIGNMPVFENEERVLPLQAADMMAWIIRAHAEDQFQGKERRPILAGKKSRLNIPVITSIWQARELENLLREMLIAAGIIRGSVKLTLS